ncbi:hypothetical protein ES705_33847 [subsurface metagenome]
MIEALEGELKMKVIYDEEAKALYVRFSDKEIVESEEIKPCIILDYDEDDNVVALELLGINWDFLNIEKFSVEYKRPVKG